MVGLYSFMFYGGQGDNFIRKLGTGRASTVSNMLELPHPRPTLLEFNRKGPWSVAEGPRSVPEGPVIVTEGPWSLTEGPWSVPKGSRNVPECPRSAPCPASGVVCIPWYTVQDGG